MNNLKIIKEQIKQYLCDIKKQFKIHNFQWKYKLFVCLPIFILLLCLDIITKQLALKFLPLNEVDLSKSVCDVFIFGGFISFSLVFNRGIAFGFNSNNLMFTIIVATFIILVSFLSFLYLSNKILLIGLIMIITGGLGNLIDRVWNDGWVVDFLVWKLFKPYSVFNLADSYIVLGVVIIVSFILFEIFECLLKIKRRNTCCS